MDRWMDGWMDGWMDDKYRDQEDHENNTYAQSDS